MWALDDLCEDESALELQMVIYGCDPGDKPPGDASQLPDWNEKQRGNSNTFALSRPGAKLILSAITLQPLVCMLGEIELLSSKSWQTEQMYNAITVGNVNSRLKVNVILDNKEGEIGHIGIVAL
jgi:hypothetical protein